MGDKDASFQDDDGQACVRVRVEASGGFRVVGILNPKPKFFGSLERPSQSLVRISSYG